MATPEIRVSSIYDRDLPWSDKLNERDQPYQYATLMTDEDTGMFVRYYTYYAGTVTPAHTHPCAHGMYVLSGTLHTNVGDYGPGSFVWFPEGSVGEHGATETGDVTCLFITNKPFDITFEDPALNEIRARRKAALKK